MTVLITGANGFVGTHLIDKIHSYYDIVGQVRKLSNMTSNQVALFELDINGFSDWVAHLDDVNTIIHLASVAHNNSNDFDYINRVNVEGTIQLAKQAAEFGVKRFIFISSISAIGNATCFEEVYDENSLLVPCSQFAQAKVDAEDALLKLSYETGMEVVIIRPVLIYGEDAPGNFGKLVNIVSKLPMLPFALCNNKRSFISIDNIVDFIYVCIEHPNAKNEVFCISDGFDISIKEFTNEIAKGLNTYLFQIPIPNFFFNLIGKITGKQTKINQLVGDLKVNSDKAKTLLSWSPPYNMAYTLSRLTKK